MFSAIFVSCHLGRKSFANYRIPSGRCTNTKTTMKIKRNSLELKHLERIYEARYTQYKHSKFPKQLQTRYIIARFFFAWFPRSLICFFPLQAFTHPSVYLLIHLLISFLFHVSICIIPSSPYSLPRSSPLYLSLLFFAYLSSIPVFICCISPFRLCITSLLPPLLLCVQQYLNQIIQKHCK